ncbi:hypothetical protein T01_13460 [Trichinella spiralis]|uniref:Uncharacterized protein n=1 Tax=Trichinella spiralis TaxID=6334 RepID=A0A0V1B5C3_TRISP|nr:hypothetical protein T01_13460 [Trichinella spiralis]
MLYWKWRFFKIAHFPLGMPGAHLQHSSLRDLSDKFELSLCCSVHGTTIHSSMTCTKKAGGIWEDRWKTTRFRSGSAAVVLAWSDVVNAGFVLSMATLEMTPSLSMFVRHVSSFMNTVNGRCQIFFAFPIASHELLKAILVQRKNEQMTNCHQLQ